MASRKAFLKKMVKDAGGSDTITHEKGELKTNKMKEGDIGSKYKNLKK